MDTYSAILKFLNLVPRDIPMIAICSVLFLGFCKAMNVVFFAPYMKLLQKREEATVGSTDMAQQRVQDAEALNADNENKLLEARVAAMKEKLAVVDQAKRTAGEIVEKAEKEAEKLTQDARAQLQRQGSELKQQALREAQSMAELVVQKLKNPPQTFQ